MNGPGKGSAHATLRPTRRRATASRPGQRTGRRISGPVSQIDVVPTLLDLMGQSIPDLLQGCSLRTYLEDEQCKALQNDVFIEWNGPNNGLGDIVGEAQIPNWMSEITDQETIEAATCDPVRTLVTPDGTLAASNADLVCLAATAAQQAGRSPISARLIRQRTDWEESRMIMF